MDICSIAYVLFLVAAKRIRRVVWQSLKVLKNEDNAGSEMGIYTIQGKKDIQDIDNARQSYDSVFGAELQGDFLPLDNRLGIPDPQNYSPPLEVGRQRTDSQDLDDMEDEINDQHNQVCSLQF